MHTAFERSATLNGNTMISYVEKVLENMPADWLNLTTHRLDIYNEEQAKSQFLEQLEVLYRNNVTDKTALNELPTAYDYIRLGHPLSCLLEWVVAGVNDLEAKSVISFSSKVTPILAVLRKNLFEKKKTRILYTGKLPSSFNAEMIRRVYGYTFDLKEVRGVEDIPAFDGSTIFVAPQEDIFTVKLSSGIDFFLSTHAQFGSVLLINGAQNKGYVSDIQHVRRRETIAMTPANCLAALRVLTGELSGPQGGDVEVNKAVVIDALKEITGTETRALLGSSGLSVQYAIMMGLIDHALENHPGKDIKIIVPPNCYGGTNDQARRVAACLDKVEVLDLPVDGGNDMVQGVEKVLAEVAKQDAVPYIIAEIPTNPRVEVPDLIKLQEALEKKRTTPNGGIAVDPVFILDQTFCPNVHFLGEGEVLSTVRTISYSSGSKFPSGGLCTAGYCVGNKLAESLMEKVEAHLILCDNEATAHQVEILARQLPSMNQRIMAAYTNTREFVNFVGEVLPEAQINFVSEELAAQGFTPSVFSLGLPTKGNTPEEKEAYKRALNLKLINRMITEIPDESKYCVSYGQLKGCYWTVPATSTQGTTKEGDKDYIVRVALSPDMDLDRHKEVFLQFVTTAI
ncbi:PLP-dependent aminotransferase family protein [Neolewinella agarilytica]|uniref:Cys/Met metabolism PLP-dependent enzyme n=1 Tax=Neolewinella agarilytica TaxID=478744 RepID=A0A1H9HMA7_9BACT|nr:PLP-dependent transferase [Neolewinella agarilytica]SEQ63447.1 Cys/Met metabolism PLP-dependent enzyme [Neolewinella agarilytica]